MRLIFIAKNKYYEETVVNNLKQLSEQDSITFFYSYEEAEGFINNHIVKNQIPLDLIISENNIHYKKATEFYQTIIKDNKRTYSNYDFKFCSIPMLLIVDKNENRSAYSSMAFMML